MPSFFHFQNHLYPLVVQPYLHEVHSFGAQLINMTFNAAFQRKMFRLIQKLNILSPVFITAFYAHKGHNCLLCVSTFTHTQVHAYL